MHEGPGNLPGRRRRRRRRRNDENHMIPGIVVNASYIRPSYM
jgi:hypothetical protein